MGELVELDVTTLEESVTVNVTEEGAVQINVVAEKGDTGATGPAGPAGPNSVTSATTSDGTANLSVNQIDVATNVSFDGGGTLFFGDGLTYSYEGNAAASHRAALELDDMALLPNDGTATIDVLNATVQGTLTANHIHGNIAGSVYAHVRAGENLAKGDPVYISGSHGSGASLIAIVSKADASDPLKMPAVGVMDANVTAQNNGHMVITGTITELNTNAYAVNAELYVASGGGFTATPPTTLCQPVARVERSNQNNGAVIVKVNGLSTSNGYDYPKNLLRTDSTGQLTVGNLLVKTASTLAFIEVTSDSYPDHAAALAINGAGTTYLYLGTSATAGGQIFAQNLTDFRDYQLPNASGTLALTSDLPTLGTNVATFLATPTSANLAAAVTNETGSGSLVFATSPTLTTPTIAQINTPSNTTTLLVTGGGANGLFGLRSTLATGYSSMELLNSGGTQMGGFGYANASAGAYADQVYFYSAGKSLILASAAGSRHVFLSTTGDVSIGSGAAANTRAVLDLSSTTKGFLPPRMTTAQRDAISSPPAGLMIYNTSNNKLNFYNGTTWETVTSL